MGDFCMNTRTITIKIPKWVPTRYQLRAWKKKLYVFFVPYRCHSCNCKIPDRYGSYVKQKTGTHPLGYKNVCTDLVIKSSKSWCRNCTKKYIHQLNLPIGQCTMCEKQNTAIMGYHYNKDTKQVITFCWHWWNGSKFCLECVDDLLDTGTFTKAY
jgi:DNA-directed RNA polymerase subunit N (RpoN/RPB10)